MGDVEVQEAATVSTTERVEESDMSQAVEEVTSPPTTEGAAEVPEQLPPDDESFDEERLDDELLARPPWMDEPVEVPEGAEEAATAEEVPAAEAEEAYPPEEEEAEEVAEAKGTPTVEVAPPLEGEKRGVAWWVWPVVILIAGLLGMLFSLWFLLGTNGTLSYAGTYDVFALQDRVETLEADVGAVQQQMDELRQQLDALQGLEARMGETETAVAALSETASTLQAQVDDLESQLGALTSALEETKATLASIQAQGERVQDFFVRLQALIAELFGEQAPTPTD